jgi:beta-1,4-N-acetylglucosaminyltransferase
MQPRRIPRFRSVPRPRTRLNSHLAIAGGHTSEALALVSALDLSRYKPRTYVVSEGDALSAQKAVALEASRSADPATVAHALRTRTSADLLQVVPDPDRPARTPRPPVAPPHASDGALLPAVLRLPCLDSAPARERKARAVPGGRLAPQRPWDLLRLVRGSVPQQGRRPPSLLHERPPHLSLQLVGLPSPKVIYVESFARVRSLSLSGKLLRRLVDRCVRLRIVVLLSLLDTCQLRRSMAEHYAGRRARRMPRMAGVMPPSSVASPSAPIVGVVPLQDSGILHVHGHSATPNSSLRDYRLWLCPRAPPDSENMSMIAHVRCSFVESSFLQTSPSVARGFMRVLVA